MTTLDDFSTYYEEGNCFTNISDATGLARIADTMRAQCSEGRLVQVCERWIYSACLCFALDMVEKAVYNLTVWLIHSPFTCFAHTLNVFADALDGLAANGCKHQAKQRHHEQNSPYHSCVS